MLPWVTHAAGEWHAGRLKRDDGDPKDVFKGKHEGWGRLHILAFRWPRTSALCIIGAAHCSRCVFEEIALDE